ncbi:MAG: hypothetical protein ABJF86_05255 [Tateyamaria sp.]|uniref:hypothetical protein n=1 Tax=Tateyamaria sp. TaxID=1929288 RepID=UPI003282AD7E
MRKLAAETALEKCVVAYEMLEDEGDETKWSIIWIGAMALIRSVGETLDKTDGRNEDGLRNSLGLVQEPFFREHWKSDPMFTDFIKGERDMVVHSSSSTVSKQESISLVVLTGKEQFKITPDLFRPIVSGYFFNEDARDVYEMAINWWSDQIKRLKVELI